MAKDKPKTPFALALAARRKEVTVESLSGAARHLFNDRSLTNDDLEQYDKGPKVGEVTRPMFPRRATFKRG